MKFTAIINATSFSGDPLGGTLNMTMDSIKGSGGVELTAELSFSITRRNWRRCTSLQCGEHYTLSLRRLPRKRKAAR